MLLMLFKSVLFISKVDVLLSVTFPSAFVSPASICWFAIKVSITTPASSIAKSSSFASKGNPFSILMYRVSISSILGLTLLIFSALYGIVFLQEGIRKVPLISSKQLNQLSLQNTVNNYLPLRFNQAGVMPIILTTAVLVLPNYVSSLGLLPAISLPIFDGFSKVLYWVSYFALILIFSSFYSTLILNPKDISDQLQKMTVSVPGIRPGIETAFYLKQVMKRVTLIGSTMLALLATLPNLIQATFNISSLNGLSTTSLLIVAGVILDVLREVKSIYYSNIYNNMYK